MSIRLKDLPPKAGKVSSTTKLATEDINDETNKTRMMPASDVVPYTYAASDEESPLSLGMLYTTEASSVTRTINDVIISLTHAPTGSDILVDVLKETGLNTNTFATILSTLPRIMVNEYTSETATPVPVITDNTWQKGRRIMFELTVNDSNFLASGLKVTLKA